MSLSRVYDLSVDMWHGCYIDLDGSVWCWGGGNGLGRIYSGSATPIKLLPYTSGRRPVRVSCGDSYTCLLYDDHRVRCFGKGHLGQLGTGKQLSIIPPQDASDVGLAGGQDLLAVDIASAYRHACAISTAGKVYCWGNSFYGEMG